MRRTKPYSPHIIKHAVHQLLDGIGVNPNDAAVKDTPDRVSRAFEELTRGYSVNIPTLLSTEFEAEYDEVVMLKNVPFHSLCEHHLMTFRGRAMVAYMPAHGRVVGLSKLARLVEAHARRLQLQERMTKGIADDIEEHLDPRGVAVIVEAEHFCMCARGVNKPGATMVTSEMRGSLRNHNAARVEVMQLWAR